MKYVVVLPAKNEEQNIRAAIESMANQGIPPRCLMVVDDGSDDRTLEIVKELALRYEMLRFVCTGSRKTYQLGGQVVRVFNEGKRQIDKLGIDYDWVVKMDADVEFESDFMARIEQRVRNRHVGIVSGTPYFEEDGKRIYDTSPGWHTHGQFKIYNAKCFDVIGGPKESLGWDCADNVAAIANGWECMSIPDINYLMHREVGGKTSIVRGRINHGIGCYIIGVGPGYFLLKAAHDIFKPPYFIGAISLLRGYFRAFFGRYPKTLPPPQRRLLRKLFWASIWDRLRRGDFLIQQKLMPRRTL